MYGRIWRESEGRNDVIIVSGRKRKAIRMCSAAAALDRRDPEKVGKAEPGQAPHRPQ